MIAVKALSNQLSITTLCRVLRVKRSTYYKWLHRSPSVRELENRSVRAAVLELYAKTDKRLGTRKIKDCLNRDYCINISCGRVYRLMKSMNLPKMSTVKPPKTPQIKTDDSNCINLLTENFNQHAPNMVWVCDFTYIRAANRFYYLCAVLDLFARKIVSFKCLHNGDYINPIWQGLALLFYLNVENMFLKALDVCRFFSLFG